MISRSKPITVVWKECDFLAMRQHLLRNDNLERVSFVFFGATDDNPSEIYVHKVINLEDGEYEKQTPTYVVPKMTRLISVFREYESKAIKGLMHVHSHPFSHAAEFSGIDYQSAKNAVGSLKSYLRAGERNNPFLFAHLVIGQELEGFSGNVYDGTNSLMGQVESMHIVGMREAKKMMLNGDGVSRWQALDNSEILDRNVKWLGEAGQKKIADTQVVICGVGGAGSLMALNIRGMGFGKITLIDHDRIEASNLNRLPAAKRRDVGFFKVDVMKRMIEDVGVTSEVEAIPGRIESDKAKKAIVSAHILVAGVDSFRTRFTLQMLAARYLKPLIDIGSGIMLKTDTQTIHFMGGQVATYIPGGPCLFCQGVVPKSIDSDMITEVKRATGYVQGTDFTPTSVATINAIMAGHAADTLLKFVTGFSPVKPYLKCDLLNGSYQIFNFQRKLSCPVCGDEGVEGMGDEIPFVLPESLPIE